MWPGVVPKPILIGDFENELKTNWDSLFLTLGERGFERLDWKPDLTDEKDLKSKALPKFKSGKNYIILTAEPMKGAGGKPALRAMHVFTNFDKNHQLWVSKLGNYGTFLHASPRAVCGDDPLFDDNGQIVAIWQEK